MSTHPIRKIIQKTGFDIRRHRDSAEPIAWLAACDIQTILDVGANVGQFAREISVVLPNATLYSFEPLKECFSELQKVRRPGPFKAFNFALGDKAESVPMHKSAYTPSSSLLVMGQPHRDTFPETQVNTLEQIEVRRMDDVCADLEMKPGILIKADVQGYEDRVIRGGIETFKRARAAIIETSFVHLYEGQPLFGEIHRALSELGFSYRGSMQQKVHPHSGEVLSQDSLFLR